MLILSSTGGYPQMPKILSESDFASATGTAVPTAPREFRGVWVATVANIDWPSRPGLSSDQQKRELIAILDKAKSLNMNAVLLQIRPNCDALYVSDLEPWSYYLSGQMGKPPSPLYDPLTFAVEEAHSRGMELHAWCNPYRALHPATPSVSASHVSKTHPAIVRKVGSYLWLDPGMKETQDYTLAVFLDIVRRYDIDGIHMDDYFYPYPEYLQGKPFPDEETYAAYKRTGGTLARDDWRRQNVNQFVQKLYVEVKKEKPWVKVGISPFGLYRPDHPKGVQGFDQYAQLYADARVWLNKGWLDYCTPQLYWAINSPQPYKKILNWWTQENRMKRHVWPGLGAHRLSDGQGWPAKEMVDQVKATRDQRGADGEIFFSMKVFMGNVKGLNDALRRDVYANPALVPASPWLDTRPPAAPRVTAQEETSGSVSVTWRAGDEQPLFWGYYLKRGDDWWIEILPAHQSGLVLSKSASEGLPDAVAVSTLDRAWNESPRTVVLLPKAGGSK